MIKVNGITLSLVAAATFLNVANADSIDLGDVSVTATKTERKVADVPASISIVTQKDIENSVASNANEILKNVAGVNIRNSMGLMSTSTTNKIYMRGFGGTDARSLVLLDGVPLNDAYGGAVEWTQVPMDSIKRIEVVKGSGSSLYGSNAMGGVINIITKKPQKQQTNVNLSYGSMNTKIGSISTTGKIDKFGYFLSGQMAKSDGYIADLESNQKDNTIKRGVEKANANLKLTYDIDDSSDVGVSYNYMDRKTTGVLDIPGGYNPYKNSMSTTQINYSKFFENSSDMKVTIYNKMGENSYDSLVYHATNPTQIKYKDEGETSDYGATLQYTLPLGNHIITTGLEGKKSSAEKIDTYLSNSATITTEGKQDYYAFFGQDEWFINEKFIVNIGARLDYYKNHGGKMYDEVNNVYTDHATKSFNAFSPKIGLVYHLTENTSIRTSIGKAFRAPTVSDLYRDWISYEKVYAGNANLDPETVISYEIGVDQKIGNGNIHITAYRSDAEDFIYSIDPLDPSSTNYKEKTNVGEVEIQGIEFEADYAFTDAWKLLANYTYNESKIKKFEANSALEGKYLTYVPKNKASVSIEYMNPNFINIVASGRYVGKRYSDDMNSESSAYESYTLYDLKLSRKITKNSQFEVSVDDLFDKGYIEYYNSPGRVVMATLKMSF
ncbi:TonB-dependent receptor [Sulfurimonas sp. CVO]|uniref:TonB-dependent receptor plug domain-containing protein n=1 Tax=Sulfurimonas sp. CVO TaxID=2283483 RepID=UPI00132E82F3|nr:TonB-dependent receptor [Sulfurimonas sp. CVO]QHG90555.1 TonB-dependent receptor [Sulfurimonas sp. CVO]